MIYRLSFTSKKQWDSIKGDFIIKDEDGNYPSGSTYTAQIDEGSITIREVGNVPYPPEYDEEGDIIKEGGFYTDFAVDIVSDYDLPVSKYIIEDKHWYNEWV
jgi:hypothetical protein